MFSPLRKKALEKEARNLLLFLLFYIFVCFPFSQYFFKDSAFIYKNWSLFLFISILSILFVTKKLSISKIGLPIISTKHLVSGLILILIPILTVIFLDTLIDKTGMAKNDLFTGAELRKPPDLSSLDFIFGGLLNPIASQIFITGYVLTVLIRNSSMAIPGNGILFSIINFNLGIGYIALGMISAGLTRLNGNLLHAIAFGTGCSLAKFLILESYPRITTLLVLLI